MADLPAGRQARRSQKKMYYLYILRSLKTGEFYNGLTNNLDRRLQQHFSGKSPSTKTRLPPELIYVEMCQDRIKARNREKYFKSGFGREIIHELIQIMDR